MSRVRSPAWPRFGELVFGAVGTVGDRPDQGEGLEPFGKDGAGHAGNAPADVVEAAAAAQDFPYDQEGPPTAQHFVGARHGAELSVSRHARQPITASPTGAVRILDLAYVLRTALAGFKRGALTDDPMSALGHWRTSRDVRVMSALPPITDIRQRKWGVRRVPLADIYRGIEHSGGAGRLSCRRPRRVATNPLCAMSKRLAGRSTLLDHRYDLSQFRQPTFEACLVDSKVAASELGPRVHR